jgi:hypothetical protein
MVLIVEEHLPRNDRDVTDVSDRNRPPGQDLSGQDELLDMIWPETGLATTVRVPRRPKDTLGDDDEIEVQIDFVTLSLTPLEFIQLASSLRMAIDNLLDHHPSLQRAVINAFDLRDS